MIQTSARNAIPQTWATRLLVVLVGAGMCGVPSIAQATSVQKPIASVRFIQHGLTVQPPNRSGNSARLKQSLFAAYGLRTGDGDRASIGFVDRSMLHINQRTDLVLRSPQITFVRHGEVAVMIIPGTRHQVSTASAVATAIGTVFDVRISATAGPADGATGDPYAPIFPARTTTVSVAKGVVVVSNARGRVNVRAGQWTHVAPGRAPTAPTRHNAKGDISWSGGLAPPPVGT